MPRAVVIKTHQKIIVHVIDSFSIVTFHKLLKRDLKRLWSFNLNMSARRNSKKKKKNILNFNGCVLITWNVCARDTTWNVSTKYYFEKSHKTHNSFDVLTLIANSFNKFFFLSSRVEIKISLPLYLSHSLTHFD